MDIFRFPNREVVKKRKNVAPEYTRSGLHAIVILKTSTKENRGLVSRPGLMSRISCRQANMMVFKRTSNSLSDIGSGMGKTFNRFTPVLTDSGFLFGPACAA